MDKKKSQDTASLKAIAYILYTRKCRPIVTRPEEENSGRGNDIIHSDKTKTKIT